MDESVTYVPIPRTLRTLTPQHSLADPDPFDEDPFSREPTETSGKSNFLAFYNPAQSPAQASAAITRFIEKHKHKRREVY